MGDLCLFSAKKNKKIKTKKSKEAVLQSLNYNYVK
jgi:hypothetical protein